MTVIVEKLAKDHYTATYQGTTGEGPGPLSAIRDLHAKLRAKQNTPSAPPAPPTTL